MRTSITISDDIFQKAERLAKQLKVSKSKIYEMAIEKIADEFDEKELIAQINAVCDEIDTSLEPEIKAYQSGIFRREAW